MVRHGKATKGMENELYVDGQVRTVGEHISQENKLAQIVGDVDPDGCWQRFKFNLRALWATRETESTVETGNRELHIKTTLRELITYIVFLIILCAMTFGMKSANDFYFTQVLNNVFTLQNLNSGTTTNFQSIATINDIWSYLEGSFLDSLYDINWYNGDEKDWGYILNENRVMGVARMRQLRVRNDSCTIHSDFSDVIKYCYEAYAQVLEDQEPFGVMNGTAWTYQTEEELQGSQHDGYMASYAGGGFIQDLPLNKTAAMEIIQSLKENLWVDRSTRVVFIDFTTYNANVNLFSVVRLVVEMPPTGGAYTHFSFRTVKLLRYVSFMDYCIAAVEMLFVIFLIYYSIEEGIEIKTHGANYFKHGWNWLDITVLVVGWVTQVFAVYRSFKVNEVLDNLLSNPEAYPDFEFISYWSQTFDQAIAVMVFTCWIKLFKYISFNKTMTQLSTTLSACAKDLAGFFIMFMIIFFAFAQLGYLIFGTQVDDFKHIKTALFTLFRIILGDFNFQALEQANRFLGPTYFILYVFFVFFVLINMFLAIINDTYSEVKSDLATQKSEFQVSDFIAKKYNHLLKKMHLKKDKIGDLSSLLRSGKDREIDFEEWKEDMKKRGYGEQEIVSVFDRFDTDGNRKLDEQEQRRMMAELDAERARAEAEEFGNGKRNGPDQDGLVSHDDFQFLVKRVGRMEHTISSIMSKIDNVLNKLETMEKAKNKRHKIIAKLGGENEQPKDNFAIDYDDLAVQKMKGNDKYADGY